MRGQCVLRNESRYRIVCVRRRWRQCSRPGPSLPQRRREAERERTRWDPRDGKLCPSIDRIQTKLAEVRSDSDVQINRQTWVWGER